MMKKEDTVIEDSDYEDDIQELDPMNSRMSYLN